MTNFFQCEECLKEFISQADKLFVCKFCKTRGRVKRIEIKLSKNISELKDNQLLVEHYRIHKLYSMNMKLKKMNLKENIFIDEIKEKHNKVIEEMKTRKIIHKVFSKLDLEKYGTSEGAIRAWDTRGRGRKEPEKKERVRGHIKEVTTRQGRVAQIQEDIDTTPEVAWEVEKAISSFTGTGYKDIRRLQINSTIEYSTDKGDIEYGKLLEEYIDKAPKFNEPIYRGISNKAATEKMRAGDVVDMKGTSSWSSDENIVGRFGLTIFRTKNPGKATSISHLSGEREKEVLVSKQQRWRVVDISRETINTYRSASYTGVKMQAEATMISVEPIIKTKSFELEIKKQLRNNVIKDRIESDKYLTIYRGDKIVYDYRGQLNPNQIPKLLPKQILKYGTSEGAIRAWDTRGRGRKTENKRRGQRVAVGTISTLSGKQIIIEADGKLMGDYIDKVQEMKDVADAIGEATEDTTIVNLRNELLRLDIERTFLHNQVTNEATKKILENHSELNESSLDIVVRNKVQSMADKVISHTSKSFKGVQSIINSLMVYSYKSCPKQIKKKIQRRMFLYEVQKMQTVPEMSQEIKAPSQFGLPKKSKKKVPKQIRNRRIEKSK